MLKAPGSDWDVNNCIASAGYVWCEILGMCVRAWEQACEYPQDCLTWYDGCNTCSLVNGEIGGCTRMYCFQQETPRCLLEPEVSIMPVVDPMPIDPSLNGH